MRTAFLVTFDDVPDEDVAQLIEHGSRYLGASVAMPGRAYTPTLSAFTSGAAVALGERADELLRADAPSATPEPFAGPDMPAWGDQGDVTP
jgi:hypothetical protein